MPPSEGENRRILGVNFYLGTANQAVDRMRTGGLLVVPAAPALKDLGANAAYREALLNADLAIPDSAFMVMIWNWLQRDSIHRVSGLEYLRELLKRSDVQQPGNCIWIMAGSASSELNLAWLANRRIPVSEECVYIAPMYGRGTIEDSRLLALLERIKPKHVIVTVGGGTQERLGLYLKRNLSYLPAIHCIGAAIAFLSGDQVRIPVWADRLYLGWLYRSVSEPTRYAPRYWEARKLLYLLIRYRDRLPIATIQASTTSSSSGSGY